MRRRKPDTTIYVAFTNGWNANLEFYALTLEEAQKKVEEKIRASAGYNGRKISWDNYENIRWDCQVEGWNSIWYIRTEKVCKGQPLRPSQEWWNKHWPNCHYGDWEPWREAFPKKK